MTPFLSLDTLRLAGDWLKSISERMRANQQHKDTHIDEALEALMVAALKTRRYLALIRDNPMHKDIAKEEELASLWSAAGQKMSYMDSALAATFLMKADYWADPQGWTAAQKNEALIELDEMMRRGLEVLLA